MKKNILLLVFVAVLSLLGGVAYAEAQTRKAIVTMTFDDAILTQFTYGLPLAEKYHIQGTLYVPTDPVGRDAWNMTWNNVFAFREAGWEIGGHTHTHPNLTLLSDDEVKEEFRISVSILQEKVGRLPVSFATPFGEFDERIVRHIAGVYESNVAAWGIEEGNDNVIGKTNPYTISRFNVKSLHTGNQLCEATKRAVDRSTWIVFAFHGIVDGSPSEYQSSVKTFEELLICITQLRDAGKLDVMVMQEALMHARARDEGNTTTVELKGDRNVE